MNRPDDPHPRTAPATPVAGVPYTAPGQATRPEPLGGRLRAYPGRPTPNLQSTRRLWGASLAQGRRASTLPDLLGSLYALCGGAHRVTARAAVAAARGLHGDTAGSEVDALHLDTAREQVRRLWLDWPAALLEAPAAALGDTDAGALRACPVLQPVRDLDPTAHRSAAMRDWLATHVLGMPPADWLEGWAQDPAAWLGAWVTSVSTWPARLLAVCRREALLLGAPPAPLRAHAQPAELARLARHLREDPGFAMVPLWRGHCAETGPWTRLADPLATAGPAGRAPVGSAAPIANAWTRLGSRVADLARITESTPAAPWLQQGAQAVAPGESIAFSEMARGLLIHWVRLDPADVAENVDDPRVDACHVVAPTEWNFHPHGAVAQALARMQASVRPERVRLLAAAFDPCVALDIEPGPAREPMEAARA
jgi:hypothetical protein